MEDKSPEIPHELGRMAGKWAGQTSTWFEPGAEADISAWQGSIRPILGGRFMLHEYKGSLGGEPLEGMAIFGYNQTRGRFETAWVDSFHNGSAILFSVEAGQPAPAGTRLFSALGSFADPTGGPDWGWRTVIEQPDPDHLAIKMYVIPPDGQEQLGVETQYARVGG
jgi:hypothetical protein